LITRTSRVGCLSLIIMLSVRAGCVGLPLWDEGPPPPHGGSLHKLPDGTGFIEIVKKETGAGATEVTGEVSFYFLKDLTTPFSPSPSTGTLTVGKKVVTLKSEGDGLVTPPGPRLMPKGAALDGTLSVDLDGKTVTIPLGVR
jgi:hypothetical protein